MAQPYQVCKLCLEKEKLAQAHDSWSCVDTWSQHVLDMAEECSWELWLPSLVCCLRTCPSICHLNSANIQVKFKIRIGTSFRMFILCCMNTCLKQRSKRETDVQQCAGFTDVIVRCYRHLVRVECPAARESAESVIDLTLCLITASWVWEWR